MAKAIKILERLKLAAIKVGATRDFILGIENSISELRLASPAKDSTT